MKSQDALKAAIFLAFGGNFYHHDRKRINHQRRGLNPDFGTYRQFYRQPVLLAGDSYR